MRSSSSSSSSLLVGQSSRRRNQGPSSSSSSSHVRPPRFAPLQFSSSQPESQEDVHMSPRTPTTLSPTASSSSSSSSQSLLQCREQIERGRTRRQQQQPQRKGMRTRACTGALKLSITSQSSSSRVYTTPAATDATEGKKKKKGRSEGDSRRQLGNPYSGGSGGVRSDDVDSDDEFDRFFGTSPASNSTNGKRKRRRRARVSSDDTRLRDVSGDTVICLDSSSNSSSSSDDDGLIHRRKSSRSSSSRRKSNDGSAAVISVADSGGSSGDLWTVKYAPLSVSELIYVDKKRINAVNDWITKACGIATAAAATAPLPPPVSLTQSQRQCVSEPSGDGAVKRIMILYGPPGCCKSTLVDLLAKHHDIATSKYEDRDSPFICDVLGNTVSRSGSGGNGDLPAVSFASRMSVFDDFLFNNTRRSVHTLFDSRRFGQKQLVIVPMTPYAHNSSQMAQRNEILRKICRQPDPHHRLNPVIFMHTISESANDHVDLARHFPREVLQSPNVLLQGMNPISKTNVIKVLKTVLQKVRQTKDKNVTTRISESVLSEIAEAAGGDIGQAVTQLQLRCCNVRSVASKKAKIKLPLKTLDSLYHPNAASGGGFDDDDDPSLSKSSFHSIHHTAGKLLYGKRQEDGRLKFDLERLAREVHSSESVLLSYLHHNMPEYFADISDLSQTLEEFSNSDTIASMFVPGISSAAEVNPFPVYAYSLSARALTMYNRNRTANTSRRYIRAPLTRHVESKSHETRNALQGLFSINASGGHMESQRIAATEIVPFSKIISGSSTRQLSSVRKKRTFYEHERDLLLSGDRSKYEPFSIEQQKFLKSTHAFPLLLGANVRDSRSEMLPRNGDDAEEIDIPVNGTTDDDLQQHRQGHLDDGEEGEEQEDNPQSSSPYTGNTTAVHFPFDDGDDIEDFSDEQSDNGTCSSTTTTTRS